MDDGTKVSPRKAVVIGAGIAGISSALYLQRDGHSVTVLDPEPPGSMTSYGNAGLIATYATIPTATPDILMRVPKMLMDPSGPLACAGPIYRIWLPGFSLLCATARRTASGETPLSNRSC